MVARYRDVQAFADRAVGYEDGFRGQLHQEIATRAVDLALAWVPSPGRVLDVGCGTGLVLGELARRAPGAVELTGVDPAQAMVDVATAQAADRRLTYRPAAAESLPFPEASFDLVVSATSFDHWADQRAGLAECRRVLIPGGQLVLTDLFSLALLPTLLGRRADRARTPLRATKLLAATGFRSLTWHRHYAMIIKSVTARR